jgi:hypothetical protein
MQDEESLKILKQRYAKGEITKKQYLEMKEDLREDTSTPQPQYRQPKQKSSHLGAIIGFFFIIFLIIGAFVLLGSGMLNHILTSSVNNAQTIAVPTVVVSGTITTQGAGTHPVSVSFGSSTVTVGSKGQYSVSLSNDNSYQITVDWASIGGVDSGTCNGGTLNLQSTSSTYSYDVSC